MDVLFLSQILPYPPDAGPRVKSWHLLRSLVEAGHQVTLLAFVREDERPHLPVVEALCARVIAVPMRRTRPMDLLYLLKSHLSGRPFLIERDDLAAMRASVEYELRQKRYEIIHADQLSMTVFVRNDRIASVLGAGAAPPARVFDAHNAVWTILDRMRQNAFWLFRPGLALETRRLRRYEGQTVAEFEHTLAVTDIDRQALLAAAGPGDWPLSVLPIAIDAQELPLAAREMAKPFEIVTLGSLGYPPNADGIRWFVHQVFPLIRDAVPEAQLTIIGKNPPADFQRMAQNPTAALKVTGFVENLAPYMDRAALVVVPVRAGGGMRVRILEAFARGMPVVTTTVGLEGIDARPGYHVEVADDPQKFAEAVIQLLGNRQTQAALSERGRKLALERYDRQVVLGRLGEIYRQLAEESR
jgi:glycosyltransferase involved in cell wall biosynthesis